jgi:broad specificity phosphatase PhoE
MRYRLIGALLVLFFGFSLLPVAYAQQAVYLIRHAEQVIDVDDPPLTEAGHRRAKAWANILRDAGIKVIYTSKKRRTMQTGEHIAQALAIPLETMPRRDVAGLVSRLRSRHANDSVLIVSHSQTIPKLVKELGYSEDGTIKREDYDNLFVIVPEGKNDATVLRLRY